jgi:broad specificity phosphatase PhoE
MSLYLISVPNRSDAPFKEFVNSFPHADVHHVYHTDDVKTEELANLIKQRFPSANVNYDPRLAERNYGEYKGMSHDEIVKENAEDVSNYLQLYVWTPPRGESYQSVSDRSNQLVSELRAVHAPEEVVVCIAGDSVTRSILHVQHGLSLADLFNMGVEELEIYELPHTF